MTVRTGLRPAADPASLDQELAMKRMLILIFSIATYVVFLATFLYLIAFVGNLQQTGLVRWLAWLPEWVPHSIDVGRAVGTPLAAAAVDLSLIVLFGLQHSVMARIGFKAWLGRHLPTAAERSVYVLLASLMLLLLFWQWRPLPMQVWTLHSDLGVVLAWSIFALGFGIVLLSTFLIDHFDLFGLKQGWRSFTRGEPQAPRFVTPFFYRLVRHPLYLGFILAFWSGPTMTVGHLLFAATMTAYILFAIRLEERDLIHHLGERYATYRKRVPMLVPGWRRRRAPRDEATPG